MKNIYKSLALMLLCALSFAACAPTENYFYTPTNECVTFQKSSASFSFTDENEPIEISLVRGIAEASLTLPLVLTQDEANVFTLSATSVTFPAGEYYASVQVTYDFESVPAGKHNFTVSFDAAAKSPAGSNTISGAATKAAKKLADYLDYATVELYSSRMNSSMTKDAEKHSVLQVSSTDKNNYRIKNVINSGIDLYINVDPENGWTITAPSAEVCQYDGSSYIKIPSTIEYQGEKVTFWIDPTPKYLKVYDMGTDHGEEYTMSMGSDWYTELKCYAWTATESKGVLTWPEDNDGSDDGWWPIYFDVIDFNPQEDAKYVDYATVEMYSSRMNASVTVDEEMHSTLAYHSENHNKYRIKNILNSGLNLDFVVDPEGSWEIVSPAPTQCPYDENFYIRIPSSITYKGEQVTFWIDQTPKYLKIYDKGNEHGAEFTMSMGDDWYSEIKAYTWMTVESKGVLTWPEDNDGSDDGWWPIYYDVIKIL